MSDPTTTTTPTTPAASTVSLFGGVSTAAATPAPAAAATPKTTVAQRIEAFAAETETKIKTEYGDFERMLIAHPKTTFFGGIIIFFILGNFTGHVF